MSHPPKFADLEIRILNKREQGYPVELTLNNAQEFGRGYLEPGFLPWVAGIDPAADGERLFTWLFDDDQLKQAWAEVRGQQKQRRLRLRIDAEAPELHAIPWELLRDPDEERELAAAGDTPFSRYLAGKWRPGGPILQRPIKILVVVSNPANLDEFGLEVIDIENEWQALKDALSGIDVVLSRYPQPAEEKQPCTLDGLERELRKGYHILHFIGHGAFKDEKAVVYMADGDNQVRLVYEDDFAAMLGRLVGNTDLRQDDRLRLVFLASCETATRSPADAFRGFAPALVRAGVPAVLAMQDLVAVDTARAFARDLYQRLLIHGQVDLASNEARSGLMSAELSGAAIPVLFMRLRNGLLLGKRGQILGDRSGSFWSTLIGNIDAGECTPFLGPGMTVDLLPSREELSRTLADEINYPFTDPENLSRVAQFIGTLDNRRLRRRFRRGLVEGFGERLGVSVDGGGTSSLAEVTQAAHWSDLSQQLFESEIHHQLADLELPLYVTTNFDNFMALALAARGHPPRKLVIPWHEPFRPGGQERHTVLDPPPNKDSPVLLHLFGNDEDLLSMVLTVDDYMDYLVRIARDYNYLIPRDIDAAFNSTTLLFLGYRLEDLELKVILRGLLTQLDLERWDMLHVAVQIESTPFDDAMEEDVLRFFQRYFSKSRIDVFWGSTQQFIAELHCHWQEHQHG